MNDILERIREIEKRLSELPVGTVTYKKINGKEQPYLQWTEGGKSKSKYIKVSEREKVLAAVAERKSLQDELRLLKAEYNKPKRYEVPGDAYTGWASEKGAVYHSGYHSGFSTPVITGERLKSFTAGTKEFKRRECFSDLMDYLTGNYTDKVAILYGLRRTGKTTLLRQAIEALISPKGIGGKKKNKTTYNEIAYIKLRRSDDLAGLNTDLDYLTNHGAKYIFLDEVTLLPDFIDGAAVLSDIYAAMGIKIVLSGTDSLGFWLSKHDELYDRTVTFHTTWIPFREHSRLLGINDIDEYIRYGGTLSAGSLNFGVSAAYAEEAAFRDEESTREYIDTAICRNIQHSLELNKDGKSFLYLQELYDAGELTGAINRIIEDTNHRFLISVLTKPFISHDFGSAADVLRKEREPEKRSIALDQAERGKITKILRGILEIKNKDEQKVGLDSRHVEQIKMYLSALDIIQELPMEAVISQGKRNPNNGTELMRTLITQPGMRYVQAQALAYAVMQDKTFQDKSKSEQEYVVSRILEEVRGRMLEEIVLLETIRSIDVARRSGNGESTNRREVYSLDFGDGSDLDMLIYNSDEDTCDIYEVKHSKVLVPEQARILLDKEKCDKIESKFGKIKNKIILYRGESILKTKTGVEYKNVEEYLMDLK